MQEDQESSADLPEDEAYVDLDRIQQESGKISSTQVTHVDVMRDSFKKKRKKKEVTSDKA